MVDEASDDSRPGTVRDNIRTLVYLFGQELDERITYLRQGTGYEAVRASDIRVFVHAADGGGSISGIARRLGISRQAVHMSAQRLKERGVIDMQVMKNSRRDMTLVLTEEGRQAMRMANEQIVNLESEISEVIGSDGLETLRKTLLVLIDRSKRKSRNSAAVTQPE
ncbi:MAG: winged helix-turn-helix transcriptional regulator [Rhizobiales bacterium]|nr:winged helix-turn-helix transcriptional regulator [Hyphomicrobiales bacterium]